MNSPAVRRVALIGFMGAGKSTVGLILARRLGLEFVDLDQLVARSQGRSIAQIFQTDGEEVFRRMESECLRTLMDRPPCVLATGGGTPIRPENRDFFLTHARTFYLALPFRDLMARTGSDGTRPLLARPKKEIEALYRSRVQVYRMLGEVVPARGCSPDEVARTILERLRET